MCKDATCSMLEDQTCQASTSTSEAACLTHIYKANENAKENTIEKSCVNRAKDGKYDCIKHKKEEVEITCDTCVEDFCNEKSGADKISLASLAVVSVIALIAPKFL